MSRSVCSASIIIQEQIVLPQSSDCMTANIKEPFHIFIIKSSSPIIQDTYYIFNILFINYFNP